MAVVSSSTAANTSINITNPSRYDVPLKLTLYRSKRRISEYEIRHHILELA
jgi:hypothetical protein